MSLGFFSPRPPASAANPPRPPNCAFITELIEEFCWGGQRVTIAVYLKGRSIAITIAATAKTAVTERTTSFRCARRISMSSSENSFASLAERPAAGRGPSVAPCLARPLSSCSIVIGSCQPVVDLLSARPLFLHGLNHPSRLLNHAQRSCAQRELREQLRPVENAAQRRRPEGLLRNHQRVSRVHAQIVEVAA